MVTTHLGALAGAMLVALPLATSAQTVSFAAARDYDIGAAPIVDTAIGDLNGDGGADVVIAARDGASLAVRALLSAADGTLTPAASQTLTAGARGHLALGDFTGDGRLDAVVDSAGLAVLPGRGDGTFGAPIVSPGYGWEIVAADFNGDGRLDVASGGDNTTAGPPETVDVYYGNGNGTFGPFNQVLLSDNTPGALSAGDLNGDGRPDLVLALRDSRQLQIFLNTGGSFTGAGTAVSEVGPHQTAIGDLSGDGRADVAAANFVPTASVFLGNGNGTLQPGQSYPVTDCSGASCPEPLWLVLADIDGNGALDVVTANRSPGSASVLFNNGAGVLTTAQSLAVRTYAATVAAADFNRDGRMDLAVTSSSVEPTASGARILSVFLQAGGSGGGGGLETVDWTNLVNAAATGGTIEKTRGCSGCFDAGGVAAQVLEAGAGAVESAVADPAMRVAAGLSGQPVSALRDLQFGLLQPGHQYVEVRENGVYRADVRIAAGDVLRIEVAADGRVRYLRNGAVFYTSGAAAGWPLSFVALLSTIGGRIANARIQADGGGPPPPPPPPPVGGWTNENHVTIDDGTITKTSGCDGCFDAAAVSDVALEDGQGALAFTIVDPAAILAVGLTDAFVGTSPGQLAFSIRLQGSGWAEVRQFGVYLADTRAAAGDVFRIVVSGGTVTYARNGTVFHTSDSAGLAPLVGVALFADVGGAIENVTLE